MISKRVCGQDKEGKAISACIGPLAAKEGNTTMKESSAMWNWNAVEILSPAIKIRYDMRTVNL